MKLLDKIKDLFLEEDEEIEDVELEEENNEVYKEPKRNVLPKVMRDTIIKEEKNDFLEQTEDFIKPELPEEKEDVVPQRKFNFPLDLDEDFSRDNKVDIEEEKPMFSIEDIKDTEEEIVLEQPVHRNINVLNLEQEVPKKVSELYQKREEEQVKPKFKASPVISPVYGVLDKNYTKEEVREKDEDTNAIKRPSKKVDFETVRKKAFGNLADEIKDSLLCENCELYKEVKKISSLKEDDLLYDMTVEDDNDVTIEKAYDNYEEFGVAYEPKAVKRKKVVEETTEIEEEPEKEKIDTNVAKIVTRVEKEKTVEISDMKIPAPVEEVKEEDEEVLEVPSRQEKKKEAKVDDDFFELIDSMYKERADDE